MNFKKIYSFFFEEQMTTFRTDTTTSFDESGFSRETDVNYSVENEKPFFQKHEVESRDWKDQEEQDEFLRNKVNK